MNPADTGHGTLYTSGDKGIIFSASLEKHLYPNYGQQTDFYKVESMRGVYIASQMSEDDSIHTRISYDRGGIWGPIPRPEGVRCKDELKVGGHSYTIQIMAGGCELVHHQVCVFKDLKPTQMLLVLNNIGLRLVDLTCIFWRSKTINQKYLYSYFFTWF